MISGHYECYERVENWNLSMSYDENSKFKIDHPNLSKFWAFEHYQNE